MPESPVKSQIEDDLQRGEFIAAMLKLPSFKESWKEVGRYVGDLETTNEVCNLIKRSRWHTKRLTGSSIDIAQVALEWGEANRSGVYTPETEESGIKMLRDITDRLLTIATVFFQMGLMVGFSMNCVNKSGEKPPAVQ